MCRIANGIVDIILWIICLSYSVSVYDIVKVFIAINVINHAFTSPTVTLTVMALMSYIRILRDCCTDSLDELIPVFKVLSGFKRSEEHTSELQSRQYLVCRLLLEKKKKNTVNIFYIVSK